MGAAPGEHEQFGLELQARPAGPASGHARHADGAQVRDRALALRDRGPPSRPLAHCVAGAHTRLLLAFAMWGRAGRSRSDDLAKSSMMTEQVVNKIKRQVHDSGGADAVASLKVDGVAPEVFLTRFRWEEAKFPTRRPLRETVDKIMEIVGRIEDDLKVRVASVCGHEAAGERGSRAARTSAGGACAALRLLPGALGSRALGCVRPRVRHARMSRTARHLHDEAWAPGRAHERRRSR